MKTAFIRVASCAFLIAIACFGLAPQAAEHPPAKQAAVLAITSHYATTPVLRPDGKKWRLGYVDGGNYGEYHDTLRALVHGLEKLRWLSIPEIPAGLDSRQLWLFLADHAISDYLEFVSDAWWQPGNFDTAKRPALRQSLANRLYNVKDIDLIVAMGTWAGQDMVALQTPVPTIVAATSDPLRAHIIRSPEDSGLDNLHARVAPERYEHQLRLFHDVVPFKRLGIVYENTREGKTYSALDAAQQVAQERGFTLVTCHASWNGVTVEQATQNVLDCYRRLAPDIDAVYVTIHRGVTQDSIRSIAKIMLDAQVPSFSMLGATEVRQGILLSLAQADMSYVGTFYAKTIARIFNGAKARQLNQIWIDPAKLVINLHTARQIGFDPPIDTLLAADEIVDVD